MAEAIEITREIFDHANEERFVDKTLPGINEEVVKKISSSKNEPEWMLKKRLQGLKFFSETKMPGWGPDLSSLNLDEITYYINPDEKSHATKWEDVPEDIRRTFERLGIPEAEKNSLAGAGSQYESITAYHNLKEEWAKKGVIFEDMDEALKKYPDLVKEYFMTRCVPINDHKFAMLHAAVWSGGTFIYVPKNVKVNVPLQAYFRMNAKKGGQFEHTLIIVDEGAEVQYIEGCSNPLYRDAFNLHAGCVEIYVKKNARARYTSMESWSKQTFNLNTKRAIVYGNGTIEWINGNTGSHVTMLYPSSVLMEQGARCEAIGIAYAGEGQNQDTGMKVIHLASNTSSTVVSKSISKDGGVTSYRGLLKVVKGAKNVKSKVQCDALMMDNKSKSNTFPTMEVKENENVDIAHEATVGKIGQDQIFYLMSRGLSEEEATKMIVRGFMEPVSKQLPLEYAIEFNRLIELELEGSLG
ncbi:Fe-S cluster assembly protein SufB [Candidatus Woesearchaeota archaeon]|nr:Fe-S cluster assembly protein SufB [Candidatus Woesearchaeota archaeon]